MPRCKLAGLAVLFVLVLFDEPICAQTARGELRTTAARALKKAAAFYRGSVASHGGYVYYYSADLEQRWGEGKAGPDTIFVQPPGTPTVGMAYLDAFDATKDAFFLDAARETAEALVYGQLESGGWAQTIHFTPAKNMGRYRNGRGGKNNVSTLDDNQTPSALQMLIRADRALTFKHPRIHEAAGYGLKALLAAQFPNGGFPQVWTGPVERKPVVPARLPDYDWKTQGRVKNYWDCYTLNDGVAGNVADTLILAHRVYKDEVFKAALARLGDFMILAQLPAPQPGWSQQYNFDMVPIWARKFEPPAVTAWEAQDVMETLIEIARYTGEDKYLEPIPRALSYYRKCLFPDGRVARYYEFRTNRPLYMNSAYQLTYDDSDVPQHYGWKQSARFDAIAKAFQDAKKGSAAAATPSAKALEKTVRRIISELDPQGRWVSSYAGEMLVGQPKFPPGLLYISSDVFSRNVHALADYLAAAADDSR